MNLINREIINKIRPYLKRKEAIIIKGMRQSGKTSLLLLLQKYLIKNYKIKKDSIYFFDLEEIEIREDLNSNPKNIANYLPGVKGKKYVFIDEIQYLDRPSNFIKIIVDHYPFIKLFATGSSSLDIKRKIQDSLIGRAAYFQLYPLNFIEFLNFKKEYFPSDPTKIQKNRLDKLLGEYLVYGGFPAVVLEKQKKAKESLLKNYINLYITKDIKNLAEIENISAFNNLTKVLSSQIGNLLNKNEISNTLNISHQTLSRYLDILNYTFITIILHPYFVNIRSRLTKTPKIYMYDPGIRNALINNFNDLKFRNDKGELFENFLLLELLFRYDLFDLYFYRNTKQNEIDFIVKDKIAIEAKYKKYKEKKVFRVFDKFSEYDNYIVNLNYNYKSSNVRFIDWWKFIQILKNKKF